MNITPVFNPERPSDSEQRVLDAIAERGTADFTAEPAAARRLHGAFIEALISGSQPGIPQLCCPLRLRGAEIIGPIQALPAAGNGVAMTLLFRECCFDSPVDFSGGDFLSLRLVHCTLPALIGISLTTRADLDLSGSQFSGVTDYLSDLGEVGDCAVYLSHAHIGGRLLLSAGPQGRFQATGSVRLDGARIDAGVNLSGALLHVDKQPAFSARSATVGGNVDLLPCEGYRCEVHGEVALVAAQITGDLNCGSARLVNPGGRTLHCEDLVVESVFLTRDSPDLPFESHGRINFLTAVVGGGLFVTNARLSPGPDYSGLLGRGGMVALNAQQIRISNSLVLYNVGAPEADGVFSQDEITPVEGWFLLAGAQMNALIDSVDTGWPAPGYIDLDGASYQRIRHLDQGELVSKRVAWLRRQFCAGRPGATSYRPQPYEQLTRVLRNSGLSREADAIAVEKIRMRLAARVDRPWLRLFPQLLMLVSHHGYSTSRAVLSFLLFVLFGAAMYTGAVTAFDQAFFPFEQAPEPTTYVLPFGLGTKAVPLGCPGLDTLHYALDFALPVIHLGQDDFCRFVPYGPARWLWLTLHSLFGLFGAALSAVVVLTLTGLLRRD